MRSGSSITWDIKVRLAGKPRSEIDGSVIGSVDDLEADLRQFAECAIQGLSDLKA